MPVKWSSTAGGEAAEAGPAGQDRDRSIAATHLSANELVVRGPRWKTSFAMLAGTLACSAAAMFSVVSVASADNGTGVINGHGSVDSPQTLQLSTSGLLMTNPGSSHSAGTPVELEARAISDGQTKNNQLWRFLPQSDDITASAFTAGNLGQLKNVESGLCLQVPGQSTSLGVGVVQASCAAVPSQQWKMVAQSGGGYGIKAAYGDVYLGYNNSNCGAVGPVASGRVVTKDSETLTCGTWQVSWVLPRTGSSTNFQQSNGSVKSLDSGNATGDWGAPAFTSPGPFWGDAPTQTQKWQLQEVGYRRLNFGEAPNTYGSNPDGSRNMPVYRLVSVPNGDWTKATCLDAYGGSGNPGTPVDTYGCDPNGIFQNNQLWIMTNSSRFTNLPTAGYNIQSTGGLVNLASVNPATDARTWPVLTQNPSGYSSYRSLSLQAPNTGPDPAQYQAWIAFG